LAALGVLMWEVFTCGDMPYSGQKNPDVVNEICHKRQHLSQPDNCPEPVFSIMLKCWQYVSSCHRAAWSMFWCYYILLYVLMIEIFTFYPRNAMLARVIATATCLSVRLSVRHAPVLCQNEES